MGKKYEINKEQIEDLERARKHNRDKDVDRQLRALIHHEQGYKGKKISEITGYNEKYLYALYKKYLTKWLEGITGNHYGGNHRNMTYEEESKFQAQFNDEADGGHITDVSAIKAAYDERVGHETGHIQIYHVLHRHGWTKKLPRSKHPKSATSEAMEASKNNTMVHELKEVFHNSRRTRLMFQDEAGFGRINKPKYCWCRKGMRPSVPCHHIREYRYVYGAVEPLTGDSCFLILLYCNTVCMNVFLEHLATSYPVDYIALVCDGAAWHKSGALQTFPNLELMCIPPYTPEMNPIEQIWRELRARGFHNEVFQTFEKVVDRRCDTICNLTAETNRSITCRD